MAQQQKTTHNVLHVVEGKQCLPFNLVVEAIVVERPRGKFRLRGIASGGFPFACLEEAPQENLIGRFGVGEDTEDGSQVWEESNGNRPPHRIAGNAYFLAQERGSRGN
jgi:hypothetical protein